MHLVTSEFMQLNIQMIQHVMFFRLQFSCTSSFFFLSALPWNSSCHSGYHNWMFLLLPGQFTSFWYFTKFLTSSAYIYFFAIQVATCKICMLKKFMVIMGACRLHNYTISSLLIFFCWFLELRRPRVLRLWRVSRKWSHRWESDRNFHMIVVRFYLQICAQEALNLRRKR